MKDDDKFKEVDLDPGLGIKGQILNYSEIENWE